MKTFTLFACAVLLVGCNGGGGDEGRDLTTQEIQTQMKSAGTNPDLPPQAKAAMEASGRYGGGSSADYGASQAQAQGK